MTDALLQLLVDRITTTLRIAPFTSQNSSSTSAASITSKTLSTSSSSTDFAPPKMKKSTTTLPIKKKKKKAMPPSPTLTHVAIEKSEKRQSPPEMHRIDSGVGHFPILSNKINLSDPSTTFNQESMKKHAWDSLVNVYFDDIYWYWREKEFPLYTMAQPSFLPVTVDHIFRNQLVDYLVGTSFDMHLNTTTVFLAVAYFDTFLIHQPMSPTLMECALFTCLLIATKMEEVTPPSFQDLRPFLQRHYTSQELLHMEATILSKLQFRLNRVTLDTFLADWLVPFSTTLQHQAWYLAYAILADSIYVDTPPSLMAAAILYCCAPHPDGYHGYTVVDFKEIIWHIEKTVALKRRCHIDRWLLKRHDIMAVTPPTP